MSRNDPARASGEIYCVANHIYDEDGVPFKLDMGIRYDDRYVRTDEGWRLAERFFNMVWEQELPLVMSAGGPG